MMRLPFSVIGGFLGAGKTTLLNHWLRQTQGQRLLVLVNDFGTLNIDASLIEAGAGDTIALTNGCVCCQIGDDLSLALMGALDSGQGFDGVVVEASGVSDPWRIAQLGRADPRLQLDGVTVLVDASAALAQSRDPLLADTLERQLKAADLIVLNKTDLATDTELSAVRAWITSVAGAVAQVRSAHAQVPLALLSGAFLHDVAPRGCGDHAHLHDDPAHAMRFETWSCRPARVFAPEQLRAWLKAPPPGLLRLKGVLRTEAPDGTLSWSEFQFAGRHGTLRTTQAPGDMPALVAIGPRGQLPIPALTTFFEAES